MRQDTNKRVKTVQRHWNGEQNERIDNASYLLLTEEYVYIKCPPMETSAEDWLATESYRKLLSAKVGPFKNPSKCRQVK